MLRIKPLGLLVSSLLTLALAAQEELRVATGITPAQNIFNRIQGPFEKATGLKLILTDARSGPAWGLLDAGTVEAASGGLTWEDWKKSIAAKGLRMPKDEELTLIQLGTDQIQVLTHPSVLLLSLDKKQLKDIFTGRVRNWKEVGGDDLPITLLLDPSQIATNDTFRGQVLEGEAFGASAWKEAPGTPLLQAVAGTPGSIGFAPKAAQESLKVNSPVTPEISRPILLLIKGSTPSPRVKKLLAFLESPEGRKLIVH